MTISSLDIPHSSDELHKQAPMQAFGDLVVKNTPPNLTIKSIIYGLLLVCGCLLPSADMFAHPFAGDACRIGVSVGEGVYSYRLIK